MEKNITTMLSKRLLMLADMVTPGNRLADVGCDHGFLDIYLVRKKICPGAIAMDVRQGPLAGAEKHIREYGLGGYIETRLSDGLAQYHAGEADTLVCAGMGGRLMERILEDGMEKAREMRELILQPQSELPRFRRFLRDAGFAVVCEDGVYEDGKYYFAMKAVCGESFHEADRREGERDFPDRRLCDSFGEHLLRQRHPVLLQYLTQQKEHLAALAAAMAAAGTGKAEKRLEEIRGIQEDLQQALLFFHREGQA